uniref:Beta-galactosidase n=1 Tax=Chenopodium quinoa TaxID=63459 RepID=A0A803LD91_CHEQI
MKNKGRFFFSTINSTLIFSLLAFLALFAFVAPLPSLSSHSPSHHRHRKKLNIRKFEIADDKFWKDGEPFRIIGGDLHYFRVLPEYWEDRLLRAKALGLNTIQTYVPWNLHEPSPGDLKFNGIADIVSFLKLCQKLGFFVMLRPGPYICAEWDLGGFPAWLLATEPTLRLRSSDPMYLELVDKWWGILLPVVAPLLYGNGGPIIMVQIENEYGSYADDKAYLHHLVKLARRHLGDDIILYTTDGGTRVTLKKGTILGDNVYSAVDFTTGDQPWPIFKLQKEFNAPGKSPPLSSEFYTGWLTHWGEKLAKTDADFTAAELEKILLRNGSVVLYMAHGGTNFGFYNGANTGSDDSDYKPDLTSYDYDAPIRETGDVDNAKFRAIRKVIEKYTVASLPPIPANNEKAGYGFVKLEKTSKLFDIIGIQDDANVVESVNPISMESVGQMHGFLLYISEFSKRDSASTLSISKGILSPVYVDGRVLHNWKMFSIPLHNLNDQSSSIIQLAGNDLSTVHAGKRMQDQSKNISNEPAFYTGSFTINSANQVKDTFLSVDGWGKGLAFINNFNLGRYWPTFGPQCNLYVPAPLLRHGSNTVVLFELDSPNTDLAVRFVQHEDFSCSQTSSNILEI